MNNHFHIFNVILGLKFAYIFPGVGRIERLLFHRELRAKRRGVAVAREADLAWWGDGGLSEQIRSRRWRADATAVLTAADPLHVRCAATRIQAVWRGAVGRVLYEKERAVVREELAVLLEKNNAASRIQEEWREWTDRVYVIVDPSDEVAVAQATAEHGGTQGWDDTAAAAAHDGSTVLLSPVAGMNDLIRPWPSNDNQSEHEHEHEHEQGSDRSRSTSQPDLSLLPEVALPAGDLVAARLLQLKKMGVGLLWLQPEPEEKTTLTAQVRTYSTVPSNLCERNHRNCGRERKIRGF